MRSRKVYVTKMQSWVGLNEADGSHKAILSIYNTHKPLARGYKVKATDSWCAATVSAAAISCGYTDIIPTECSCGRMIELAQKKGIWVENDAYKPQAADIILYDWNDSGKGDCTGWPEHIGVVECVNGSTITVIEGNLNNKVGRRYIEVNAKNIRGYICPKFDKEEVPALKSVDVIAKEVIDGKWGNGTSRKTKLQAAGYDYDAVQAAVNAILSGNKASKPVSTVKYYKKYTGKSNSLVDALKSLKIDSAFSNRKKIAKANGITLYLGTGAQNTKLLNLLKQGKLVQY